MNISKEEAESSLAEVNQIIDRTRKFIANGAASPILIMWGIFWAIGYTSNQFMPHSAGFVWMILVPVGSLASWVIGARQTKSIKRELNGSSSWHSARIGIFWLVLFAYAGIWMFLLTPKFQTMSGEDWMRFYPMADARIGAYWATIPMFAYIIGGLWLDRFFVWLGAGVTVLTLIGFALLPQYFNLWMAIMGGGSLLIAGLYIPRRWK